MYDTSTSIRTGGRLVAVEGSARLFVSDRGPADAPVIVFLHGGGRSMDDFEALDPRLATYRRLYIDTRGHGASTLGEGSLSYPRLARDCEAVLAELGVVPRLVVGHSDGGITALWVAIRNEVVVDGIVTLAADAEPPSKTIIDSIYSPMTADGWRQRFGDEIRAYEARNPEPDFDRLFSRLKELWTDTGDGNYPADRVGTIDVEALVLGGDDDHLVPRSTTVDLSASIPGATLGIVPFATHMFFAERPDEVARAISLAAAQAGPDRSDR